MDIAEIEQLLGITFPSQHRAAFDAIDDPVHEFCDFLMPNSQYRLLRIVEVNSHLHSSENPNPWPSFLVAFASNGCADYYAYDLRHQPPTVAYIDPDVSVLDNLVSSDQLKFESFASWYAWKANRTHKA